jgi:Ca2+-binding EF-hand superfamily protein
MNEAIKRDGLPGLGRSTSSMRPMPPAQQRRSDTIMKTILGATALCLVTIAAGAEPAAAQDINIYVSGEEGATVGPAARWDDRGPHMRSRGADDCMYQRMRRGHGHRGWHDDAGRKGRGFHHDGGHRGKMGHGRGMHRVLDLIELYDQDGDGKVTQAEIDNVRADRLAEFDSDGNGALSLKEYEALWLDAMRERMVDRFQSHDDDGDGQVTADEFSDSTSRLVMRRDRNDDGAISLEDMRRGDRGRRGMCDRGDDD